MQQTLKTPDLNSATKLTEANLAPIDQNCTLLHYIDILQRIFELVIDEIAAQNGLARSRPQNMEWL